MDKDTVSKMLENAEKEDLLDIISNMSQANHKAEKIILDWCKKIIKVSRKKQQRLNWKIFGRMSSQLSMNLINMVAVLTRKWMRPAITYGKWMK